MGKIWLKMAVNLYWDNEFIYKNKIVCYNNMIIFWKSADKFE